MKKVWFFGDSYCAYKENWVEQVALNLNADIMNLGVTGSSLSFLLDDLVKKSKFIEEEDTVILCITGTQREYFNKLHFSPWTVLDKDTYRAKRYLREQLIKTSPALTHNLSLQTDLIYDTYKVYLKNLYDSEHQLVKCQAIFSHIINNILPSLKTKNTLTLFSIDSSEYLNYKFLGESRKALVDKSLWHLTSEFLEEKLKITSKKEQEDCIMSTKNHWIDTPEFKYYFWETFNPYFEKIGAATPLESIGKLL